MIQGTSSNVGKSVLAAAFCRIFYQEGYQVSPFKAQNMALNSFITITGGEMGRAQVVQAQAAGVEPDVRMNPILLKPTGHTGSQVVIMGKAQGTMSALSYHGEYQRKTWPVVQEALHALLEENEVVIIEGAGSPAEVNLKQNDIVNMRVALEGQVPVLLVADIDRGGALASVVGTLELLEPEERQMIRGIILNKFRGDLALLQPALDFLEQKTGIPVVGVVPYFDHFRIPEEDSVVLEERGTSGTKLKQGGRKDADGEHETDSLSLDHLDIAVIRLPYLSNFTDFDPLEDEADVTLRYVKELEEWGSPDLVIIPGSKNTLADLRFLWESGLAEKIYSVWKEDLPVIGICGGYQMLGKVVRDPLHTESDLEEIKGLGILPMETEFALEKHTVQSRGEVILDSLFLSKCQGEEVQGYEIHMGRSFAEGSPLFQIKGREKVYGDGVQAGSAIGTYLHGLFDNDSLRSALLEWLWERRGEKRSAKRSPSQAAIREQAFNELAELVRKSIDLEKVRHIMGLGSECSR
ncbi:cobyric acid synthase [Desulfitobacterium sp. AusDCA]|uniref:cobyric acid synthase n=1 Tax=Desulfitobacterium sp. AusDCA TaxID=3240383 RepID=UPI003DA743E6